MSLFRGPFPGSGIHRHMRGSHDTPFALALVAHCYLKEIENAGQRPRDRTLTTGTVDLGSILSRVKKKLQKLIFTAFPLDVYYQEKVGERLHPA